MLCFYFCVDVVRTLKLASGTQDAHDQFTLGSHLKLYFVVVQTKLHLSKIMIVLSLELRKPPVDSII